MAGRSRKEPAVPPTLALAAAWSWRLLAVGVAGYFVIAFLARLPIITLPIFMALLLSALLHRPVALLRRWLPAWLASLGVLVTCIALLSGVGWLLAIRFQTQADTLAAQTQHVIEQLRPVAQRLPGIGGGSGDLLTKAQSWVQGHASTLASGALSAGGVLAEAVTGLILAFFLTLFFLIDGERQWSWLVRLLPRPARPAVNGAAHRAFDVLAGYIAGATMIAIIHAVVIGVTLWLLGTPVAFALAVLVFIGSFIPIAGALLFGGLSVLITLLSGGLWPAVILLAVLLIESLLEAHVYQPLIMGHTVALHPVAILLVLTAGGVLGGVFGAIVAIPIAAAVSAAVKYLTGIEDINGHTVNGEDRSVPEPPPPVIRGSDDR